MGCGLWGCMLLYFVEDASFLIWDRLLLFLYYFSFKEVFSFPEIVLKSGNAWERLVLGKLTGWLC